MGYVVAISSSTVKLISSGFEIVFAFYLFIFLVENDNELKVFVIWIVNLFSFCPTAMPFWTYYVYVDGVLIHFSKIIISYFLDFEKGQNAESHKKKLPERNLINVVFFFAANNWSFM